jgi:hypothetical protein
MAAKLLEEKSHAAIISHFEGPRLSIPIDLIRKIGDLAAAAMLQQAAYLSSLKSDSDYWFDLPQTGPGADQGSLFTRLGSWEATISLGVSAQRDARKKIEKAAPGLLQVRRAGVPARLIYRVHPSTYIAYLTGHTESIQIVKNRQSRRTGIDNLDCEKSTIKTPGNQQTIPKSIPKIIPKAEEKERENRENSSAHKVPTLSQPSSPAHFVNEIGITVETGNQRDEQTIAAIKLFDPPQIEAAIAQAASSDAAGRAFPTATLKILRREKPGKGEEGMMFGDWLAATVASGEDAIPAADPVFQYAETAGIPDDFLKLQWGEFKQRYSTNDKRYKDWREVFRKSVRGNWFRLWALREGQDAMLTTAGVQANRVMQASERAEAA